MKKLILLLIMGINTISFSQEIDWDKADKIALEQLTAGNVQYAIYAFELVRGNGSISPDIHPLPYHDYYTSTDGAINSSYLKCRWGRTHHGVDLRTRGNKDNQLAVATCYGTVKVSSYNHGSCGGMILLDCDDGKQVQYCHMDFVIPADVIVGKKVPQGFPLGVTGGDNNEYEKNGNSGGPHLHYGIWDSYSKKISLNPHILYPNLFPSKSGAQQPATIGDWNKCGK
jgi:murein DD-endopeptidase MepM/ murein hydrolase activator NlpD